MHLRYRRAALAFMGWQVERGLLNGPAHERPGSQWWRAVNEQPLRDTCEARLRLLGHPAGNPAPAMVGRRVGAARDVAELLPDGIPLYAWDPEDKSPWRLPANRLVRVTRRVFAPG